MPKVLMPKLGRTIGHQSQPRGAQLPKKTAGGPVMESARIPEANSGANRHGARRGSCHSSATHGPCIHAANKHTVIKVGAAALEEIGRASGTVDGTTNGANPFLSGKMDGAANGLNHFGSRTEKMLIDPPSMPETSRNGCSGQNRSSGSCAGRTGDGHSYSKRSKG